MPPKPAKNTRFIASGKQGCVFRENFPHATTSQCEPEPTTQSSNTLVTKVMKDEEAYEKEKAAAAILRHHPDARIFTVYAVRACHVKLETLDGELLEECNANNKKKNEPVIDFTGIGYIMEMPYVEHKTLATLKPGDLTQVNAREYFGQLQAAIEQLHKWDIYHYDLHDENVWIAEGRIMIADFGGAQILQSTDIKVKARDIRSAIPSFRRLWFAVNPDERGGIEPKEIERHMDQYGTFYRWPEATASQCPRCTAASHLARRNMFDDTPPSSGRRQRSLAASHSPASRPPKRGALNFDHL